jgi:hypothetical protein
MHKYITFTLIFLILIWWATSAVSQWKAHALFNQGQSLNPNKSSLNHLTQAISLDPSNAEYHFQLAETYTQMMRESWKKGKWKLENDKWVFDPGKKTLNYALKALYSYKRALSLQPTDSNYHLSLAWHYGTLTQLSTASPQETIPLSFELSALIFLAHHHFETAVSLAPTSSYAHRLYGLWAFNQLSKDDLR